MHRVEIKPAALARWPFVLAGAGFFVVALYGLRVLHHLLP